MYLLYLIKPVSLEEQSRYNYYKNKRQSYRNHLRSQLVRSLCDINLQSEATFALFGYGIQEEEIKREVNLRKILHGAPQDVIISNIDQI